MARHLILNPAAGRGSASREGPGLVAAVEAGLGPVTVHRTAAPGEARDIAASLRDSGHDVIAAGGDGTIHEVVNGLAGGTCRLGIIPVGSGNDFVKILRIPQDVGQAVAIIAGGHTRRLDVGAAGERCFINQLGAGFDADVVLAGRKVTFLRGFPFYLASVARALIRYRNRSIDLVLDGQRESLRVLMVIVGNGRYAGGGFMLTPRAEPDDGELDVCIFSALNIFEIMRHLPKAINGTHIILPQVRYFRARRLDLHCRDGMPVQGDGEMFGERLTDLTVEVMPGALEVFCRPLDDGERSP